jgi:hypothetical protein
MRRFRIYGPKEVEIMNRYSLAAIAGITLLAAPAIAQETLSTVIFADGENGGALEVAQSFYGRSQAMETAIVDVDNDGSAEIAVRFTEGCTGAACQTSILLYSDGEWLQIFQAKTEALGLSSAIDNGLRELETSGNTRWFWSDGYYPIIANGDLVADIGEVGTELTREEQTSDTVRYMVDIEKRLVDIDGDGSKESFVYSDSAGSCTGAGSCPAAIFSSDGKELMSLYALEGEIRIHDGAVHVQKNSEHLSYAYDGKTLSLVASAAYTPVTAR